MPNTLRGVFASGQHVFTAHTNGVSLNVMQVLQDVVIRTRTSGNPSLSRRRRSTSRACGFRRPRSEIRWEVTVGRWRELGADQGQRGLEEPLELRRGPPLARHAELRRDHAAQLLDPDARLVRHGGLLRRGHFGERLPGDALDDRRRERHRGLGLHRGRGERRGSEGRPLLLRRQWSPTEAVGQRLELPVRRAARAARWPPERGGREHGRIVRRHLLPGHQRPVERQPAQEPGRGRGGPASSSGTAIPLNTSNQTTSMSDAVEFAVYRRADRSGRQPRARFPSSIEGERARPHIFGDAFRGGGRSSCCEAEHLLQLQGNTSHEPPQHDLTPQPPPRRDRSPPAGRPRPDAHRGLPHHDLPGRGQHHGGLGHLVGRAEAPRLRALAGRLLRHAGRREPRRGARRPRLRGGRDGGARRPRRDRSDDSHPRG